MSISVLLLSLLVANLGVALGAGAYEARIVVPEWFREVPGRGRQWNADAARRMNVGLRFWTFATTLPLTLLLLANTAAAWSAPPSSPRHWWLATCAVVCIERLMTFGYFIPTMIALTGHDAGDRHGDTARALRWSAWGSVRLALTGAALGLAIRVLLMT